MTKRKPGSNFLKNEMFLTDFTLKPENFSVLFGSITWQSRDFKKGKKEAVTLKLHMRVKEILSKTH